MNPRIFVFLALLLSFELLALDARYSAIPVTIDGIADDGVWQHEQWYKLNQSILGGEPKPEDFSGRFKLAWDENYLYLLAEITDDILFDQHADPLYFYWDDDCLEVFIDEDKSGGNHQFNHNAFAYHISLDNQVVDIAGQNADKSPQFALYNQHVKSSWKRNNHGDHTVVWEVAIELHDASFSFANEPQSSRKLLEAGKRIGFMLAYCDNDGSQFREHFIGSTPIAPINGDKNLGYITADVFDQVYLMPRVND